MMDLNLEGKVAIVCGSTDGIGKACAQFLSKRGALIILAARNKKKLLSTINTLDGDGHQYICSDFNNPDDLKSKVHQFLKHFKTVDILMNNSGGPPGGDLINSSPSEFRVAFERHIISSQVLVQAVVPGMKKKGYGRIINIVSTSVNQVMPGLGVSNTIRGAVAQWAKTLAVEIGQYGITTNNILPGYINTKRLNSLIEKWAKEREFSPNEMIKIIEKNIALGRIGSPSEIASTVAFLASESAGYINGINLTVDGGKFG